MNWLYPDRYEYLQRPCRVRIRVYGGIQKDQRRNLKEIPVGTEGVALQRVTDGESSITHLLCRFPLEGHRYWVRCAEYAVELL